MWRCSSPILPFPITLSMADIIYQTQANPWCPAGRKPITARPITDAYSAQWHWPAHPPPHIPHLSWYNTNRSWAAWWKDQILLEDQCFLRGMLCQELMRWYPCSSQVTEQGTEWCRTCGGVARGGGGGHWLFELGYQLRNYSPPFWTKDSPWFCHIQIYSPLFSWMLQNSPLKSALSGKFPVLHVSYFTKLLSWKVSRTNLNAYNCYLM